MSILLWSDLTNQKGGNVDQPMGARAGLYTQWLGQLLLKTKKYWATVRGAKDGNEISILC